MRAALTLRETWKMRAGCLRAVFGPGLYAALLWAVASVAQAVTISFATPGSTNWTVPDGVSSVTVEA